MHRTNVWLLLACCLSLNQAPLNQASAADAVVQNALTADVVISDVVVHVVDARGKPAPDAVVTVTSTASQPTGGAVPAPATFTIDQKNETFVPYVQVFRPGDRVVFRNSDTTRHHVYSFSAIKRFEFVLRRGQSSPALVLDKPGIAAVGCNIHDHMIAYLFVTAAPVVAVTDTHGKARLVGLGPGTYTVHVWHPQLYPDQPAVERVLTIAAGKTPAPLNFRVKLMPDPRGRMDREHMDY